MGANINQPIPSGRLTSLLNFLADDPDNVTLLTDAAETALTDNRPDIARDVLSDYAQRLPLPANALNLAGLAAMRLVDFASAANLFAQLLEFNPTDTSLRFNMAWSLAMLKDFDGALHLLDAPTVGALGQAAMLEVQLLHDRGDFDNAAARAKQNIVHHPNHEGLLAVVSVLALDIEDPALAKDCALRAGNHADALTTLGTLALGDDRDADAKALFERALERNSKAPRAWVGKGLAELVSGAHEQAARDIEHGAVLFGDHIGSWIAAGWAKVISKDVTGGRLCFETALALDHNFAESHGSLAVAAVFEGRIEDARRLTQTALRLDKQCFSGALAQSLLLNSDGKPELARKLVERALNTPIDAGGRTIAQSLAKHGLFS